MASHLKLTVKSLKYLRDSHGIDLFSGGNVAFDDPDVVAALYVAGSQHLPSPPTLEHVETELSAVEIYEAVSGLDLFARAAASKKPVAQTAPKGKTRKRTR